MKYSMGLLLSLLALTVNIYCQEFNRSINKDSLFQVILKDFSEPKKSELSKIYNEGNEESKEFLLFMLSMPLSSKKELVANIDSNYEKISVLKTTYSKLVPQNYEVSIEFNPSNKIISTKESIDLRIEYIFNQQRESKQEWNLEYNSEKLAQMIKPLGWTSETLTTIKKLLSDANCISIENGSITTIGFARSGMGKYYFKLFENDLTDGQIKQYNDGCTYIFYKKNIVLQYGGGAIGSQCFPD